MRSLKPVIVLVFVVGFALATLSANITPSRALPQTRGDRFTPKGAVDDELPDGPDAGRLANNFTEAPAGFDNLTNGFDVQGAPFDTIDEDNVVPLRSFNDNRFIFEEAETIADGLGPTYNAQGCRECHQNVVTGGASQIAEHRTGRMVAAHSLSLKGARWYIRAPLTPTSWSW